MTLDNELLSFLTIKFQKYLRKYLHIPFKYLLLYRFKKGGLAQLASAFDWQSKGHGFESRILHEYFTNSAKAIKPAKKLQVFSFSHKIADFSYKLVKIVTKLVTK